MPGAHDEIRTLLPPTLRRGTERAVTALATELRDGERAISLVSGSVDALPRSERAHLLCVTDQGLLLASLAGGSARIEFYRRRSNLPRVPEAAKQQVGRLADRVRKAARSTGGRLQASRSEPPLEQHDDVSDADLLSHLLALHEAGLITDTELAAKRAALEDS